MLTVTNVSTSVHSCKAGFTATKYTRSLWVESPRTGNRIEIRDGWFADLPERVRGRVAKARSEGRSHVEFTTAELIAIKAIRDGIDNRPRLQRGPIFGTFSARRRYGRR